MTILIKRLFVFAALIFAIGSVELSGQVQAINGSIQGDVTDSAGAAVPGAAVEADEVETGTIHSAVTDAGRALRIPFAEARTICRQDFQDWICHHRPAKPRPHRGPHHLAQVDLAGSGNERIGHRHLHSAGRRGHDLVDVGSWRVGHRDHARAGPQVRRSSHADAGRKHRPRARMATRSTSTDSAASSTTSVSMAATTTTAFSASSQAVSARLSILRSRRSRSSRLSPAAPTRNSGGPAAAWSM